MRGSNAAGRPARLQTLQEIQKANRLPGAIPLGLGEQLKNATARELRNGLVDRGFGSPLPEMLQMVESEKLNPGRMVGGTVALEKASDVLASMGGYDTVAMSVITEF